MNNTWKRGVSIVFQTLLIMVSLSVSAFSKDSAPVVLVEQEGKQWVNTCVDSHPELLWLADSKVRKTEEGEANLQGSYSEQLFGKKYTEFDRTIMTLHCLRLILDGSDEAYHLFTEAQPHETKLTIEDFETLHLQGKKLLQSKWGKLTEKQMAQAMETALVLGDIGKSEKARDLFKPYGVSAPDHDDFYGEAMKVLEKHPKLCPSFAKLSSSARKLLGKVANIAHYGHITHLEGDASMFRSLKESGLPSKDPLALSFDLFVHTCDVAGALGHVNNQSSLTYTRPTHNAIQAMEGAIQILADPKKTEWDAYNDYIEVRAMWLGLNEHEASSRVLARIGSMLRLFTPEEGIILHKAMQGLDKKIYDRIIAQFDVHPNDKPIMTPTYMPAVLANLSNNTQLGNTKEKRLTQAITLGLPFISRVLEKYKEMVSQGQIDPRIPLNFNKAAGIAKASPQLLSKDFKIDKEGNVILTL